MHVVICDDDKKDIERLRRLLEEYGAEHDITFQINEYDSGKVLISSIEGGARPDIIFPDINMDEMDGLTLAKRLREKLDGVPLVPVIAYISYALDGYKVRASRFLIKDDLELTFPECMDDICAEIRKKKREKQFQCAEGRITLKLSEIIVIETKGHRNQIRLESQYYYSYEKLDILEEELKGHGFLRVHKSYLVNMAYIRRINNYLVMISLVKE